MNLLIATMIATTIDRAVSYLYYADRVYQLPLGVVGVAIGVVLLPELSRKLRAGDEAGALASQNRALELALFLTMPATIALDRHAARHRQHLFRAWRLHPRPTRSPRRHALAAFAIGLPAFVMIKVFSPGFFAREDTKTPMMFAITSVVVNIVGEPHAVALHRPCRHCARDRARRLGQCHAARPDLARRGHYAPDERLRRRLPRIIACEPRHGRVAACSALLAFGRSLHGDGILR